MLGPTPETVRKWVRRSPGTGFGTIGGSSSPGRGVAAGEPGASTSERDLESGIGFFRAGALTRDSESSGFHRPVSDQVRDAGRSVGCLSERNVGIAPSTYYAVKSRPPSVRAQRDGWLIEQIRRTHQDNYEVYGAAKVWAQLNRQGTQVARCTVERLMRQTGLRGVSRGRRKVRTTLTDTGADYPVDLVERDFTASAPDRL